MTLLFGALVLVGLVVAAGTATELSLRWLAQRRHRPDGELVDVGGHQLHAVKKGRGSPSVVFESGGDVGGHLSWKRVQEEVSRTTTTLSYDRAGVLWSERGGNPKSAQAMASELRTVLAKTGCAAPYVVVGHSLGGLTLRQFVADAPDEICGVVLVDAAHPEQFQRLPPRLTAALRAPPLWLVKLLFSTGLGRLLMRLGAKRSGELGIATAPWHPVAFKGLDAMVEEAAAAETLGREVAGLGSFGDIPLRVITAASPNRWAAVRGDAAFKQEVENVWRELQTDLLSLSTNHEHTMAHRSGHYVQSDQPDLVIDAINSLIER